MNATATAQSVLTHNRVFNFSAGPAALPVAVLEEMQRDLLCYPRAGASVMELSHRGKVFVGIIEEAEATIRQLLNVPEDYDVLFLQGGSALQFSMIPANLLRGSGKTAKYVVSGTWSKKAITEAKKEGEVVTAFDGSETNFDRLPHNSDMEISPDDAYLYYCSNETIHGVQFQTEPEVPDSVPLVCDASSDFLSRPIDVRQYGLIYACAQKNAGPAGVTVVIARKDLVQRGDESLPGYLQYRTHAGANSMWNTPPTFSVYTLGLVAKWLRDEMGGLESMQKTNETKAEILYNVIDELSGFYLGHAQPEFRSRMNVTFNLPSPELLDTFVTEAATHKLESMKGHRSVGGIRASIYNAMPIEGVQSLAQFMRDFAANHG